MRLSRLCLYFRFLDTAIYKVLFVLYNGHKNPNLSKLQRGFRSMKFHLLLRLKWRFL